LLGNVPVTEQMFIQIMCMAPFFSGADKSESKLKPSSTDGTEN